MKMKLPKRAARFRTKIIQEHHLDKEEQRLLDAVATSPDWYAQAYRGDRPCEMNFFMVSVAFQRIGKVVARFGASAVQAAQNFEKAIGAAGESQGIAQKNHQKEDECHGGCEDQKGV